MPPDEHNGFSTPWQILLKVNMVLIPLVIAWATWATVNIFELRGFQGQGPRFTAIDADNKTLEMREWTRMNFVTKDIEADIREMKRDVNAIKMILAGAQIQ